MIRVLYIEDDAMIGKSTYQLLQHEKFQVDWAQTGLQAAFAQAVSGLGVVEIRGKGLYWGIEIAADGAETATARATRITNHMRQNGVLLSNSGPDAKVLKIRPPLVFEQEHAQMLVAALKQALQA